MTKSKVLFDPISTVTYSLLRNWSWSFCSSCLHLSISTVFAPSAINNTSYYYYYYYQKHNFSYLQKIRITTTGVVLQPMRSKIYDVVKQPSQPLKEIIQLSLSQPYSLDWGIPTSSYYHTCYTNYYNYWLQWNLHRYNTNWVWTAMLI